MDLNSLTEAIVDEGVWFTPSFPDGSKGDFDFLVIGRNSSEYRRIALKNLVKLSSNRKGAVEEVVSSAETFLVCVKNWRGLTEGGKEYPCTRENKESMYKNPKLRWLTEQIESFCLDDSNFFLSVKES